VSELAKTKLERPKRLGEVGRRWWGEVNTGAWAWHRQVRGVEGGGMKEEAGGS
jgi:hypothetical protein